MHEKFEHPFSIMTDTSLSTSKPDPELELELDPKLKIIADLCMDYGYMVECTSTDRQDKRHSDLLFGVNLFEDSIINAQEFLSGLKDTEAINAYIKTYGREGYESVDDLLRLETNLWNEQFR